MPPLLAVAWERLVEAAIVSPRGEIDRSTAPLFTRSIASAVSDDVLLLVVDLTRVEFLESKGVISLLQANDALRHRKGELVVVCPPHLRRVLALADPTAELRVVAALEDAFSLEPAAA